MSASPIPSVAPIALQPGEGEALWFLGVLVTIKSSAETTNGRVAVTEISRRRATARRCTSTATRTSGSTSSRAS